MGYSEVRCQICGVSFNVSRYPTKEEVLSWLSSRPWLGRATHGYSNKYECMRAGCQVIETNRAELEFSLRYRPDNEDRNWEGDRPQDGDNSSYQPETPSVEDIYEHETPNESEEEPDTGVSEAEAHTGDAIADSDDSSGDSLYREFVNSLPTKKKGPYDSWSKHMRPIYSTVTYEDDHYWMDYQHVSGLGCRNTGAYNGHLISTEEARGCCTLQCLVPKSPSIDFLPDPHDEPFEKTGGFFLSGLCDSVPSRDDQWPTVYPGRHKTFEPMADNFVIFEDTTPKIAVPFHPSCFEIFKRACLHRYGEVKIEALTDWFSLDATLDEMYNNFPRDKAVERASSQWWDHLLGDEYLIANPCFIPTLESYLTKAMDRGSAIVSPHEAVIGVDISNGAVSRDDSFSKLAFEIRLEILVHLGPNDIANLRLTSRAFKVLPQYLFREIFRKHYPWVYEAWCTLPYSFWATKEAWEVEKIYNDEFCERTELESIINTLRVDATPDWDNNGAIEAMEERLRHHCIEFNERFQPQLGIQLSQTKTDWYRIYCDISRNRHQIKGLRNRERIWKDCNEILDRVDKYRAAGRLGPEMTDTERRLQTWGEWDRRNQARRHHSD